MAIKLKDACSLQSYDKPRPCTKKQRHHFADRGPYSQSYGFSSSRVRIWELGDKETWVLKNRCLVLSDSLRPYGWQHSRLPCPSPSPRACSNSCPLSRWCCPTVSFSDVPFSSCFQWFPAQGLFQWIGFLYQVAKVLELQLQHQSFQWILRIDFL